MNTTPTVHPDDADALAGFDGPTRGEGARDDGTDSCAGHRSVVAAGPIGVPFEADDGGPGEAGFGCRNLGEPVGQRYGSVLDDRACGHDHAAGRGDLRAAAVA